MIHPATPDWDDMIVEDDSRFLGLERYRQLPQFDELPDLFELDEKTPTGLELDNLIQSGAGDAKADFAPPTSEVRSRVDAQTKGEDRTTPEESSRDRYLFDLRVNGYLRDTAKRAKRLLSEPPPGRK